MVGVKNCALLALLACSAVAVLPTLATAEPATPAAPAITHPQDDWAGSQIEKHEGGASTQDLPVLPDVTDGTSTATAVPVGLDVSGHQPNVNWPTVAHGGAAFAYIKATEGNTYVNPIFGQQYNGAYNAGLVRGAYHFATPNTTGGVNQANYFLSHGGGWTADGRTLPPALDLEYNPYGQSCYGMSPAALGTWVREFVNTVKSRIGRLPTIYTSTSWWGLCMGKNASFGGDPLWIARYNKTLGALPPGWTKHAIWQYADAGRFPGDQDTYNGSLAQLHELAHG